VARTRSIATLALLVAAPITLFAQTSLIPPPYAEYRVDAIMGRGTAVQGGAGVTIPLGIYVRLGLTGALGATEHAGDASLSGRTDAIARFLFDPLRETPYALSLGGGVSVPYERGRRVRPYLTAVADIEGRRRGRFTPAVQFGLGGGARVGFVLRASSGQRR
jgi:hypothetical protein